MKELVLLMCAAKDAVIGVAIRVEAGIRWQMQEDKDGGVRSQMCAYQS